MNIEQATEHMLNSYIEAVYFTDTGDSGQPPKDATLTNAFKEMAKVNCMSFLTKMWRALSFNKLNDKEILYRIGHDFWLTRNGHGSGFWDRPVDWYGTEKVRDTMDSLAQEYGEEYSDFYGERITDVQRYCVRPSGNCWTIYDILEAIYIVDGFETKEEAVNNCSDCNQRFINKLYELTLEK